EHIVQSIAVHVAGGGDGGAGLVAEARTVDAVAARAERSQIDRRRVRLAEDDERRAVVQAAAAGFDRSWSAEHDVGLAVAVNVAGAGHGRAYGSAVARRATGDAKALRSEGRQVDRRRRRLAEDHVHGTGLELPLRTDDGIRDAVAVDVTRVGH